MSILRNDLQGKYCQIPNELITDTRLSNGAFRVLCLLFSKPDNWKVFNKAIMRELGIKKIDTLSAYWKECLESGWLERVKITDSEDGTIGAYDYSLNLSPKMVGIPEEGIPEKRVYPKNGEHNNTNSKNNTEDINNNPLPPFINPDVWAEWVQHRKEIKKTLTPLTIKKQIAQLEKFHKLGMDTSEVIYASITNGWAGLFAIRKGAHQTNGNGHKTSETTAEAYERYKQEQNSRNGAIDAEVSE